MVNQSDTLLPTLNQPEDYLNDNELIKSAIAIEQLWDTNGSLSEFLR